MPSSSTRGTVARPELLRIESIGIGVGDPASLAYEVGDEYAIVGERVVAAGAGSTYSMVVDPHGAAVNTSLESRRLLSNAYALYVDGDCYVSGTLVYNSASCNLGVANTASPLRYQTAPADARKAWFAGATTLGPAAGNGASAINNAVLRLLNLPPRDLVASPPVYANTSAGHLAIDNAAGAVATAAILGRGTSSPLVFNTQSSSSSAAAPAIEFHIGRSNAYFSDRYAPAGPADEPRTTPSYAGQSVPPPSLAIDANGRVAVHAAEARTHASVVTRTGTAPASPDLHVEGALYARQVLIEDPDTGSVSDIDAIFARVVGTTVSAANVGAGSFQPRPYRFPGSLEVGALLTSASNTTALTTTTKLDVGTGGAAVAGTLNARGALYLDEGLFARNAPTGEYRPITFTLDPPGNCNIFKQQGSVAWWGGRLGVGVDGEGVHNALVVHKMDPDIWELELADTGSGRGTRVSWIGHPRNTAAANDGSLVFSTAAAADPAYLAPGRDSIVRNIYFMPGRGKETTLTYANPPTLGVFSTNAVGVNTFNPQASLHVEGDIACTGGYSFVDAQGVKRNTARWLQSRWMTEDGFVNGAAYIDDASPYVGVGGAPASNVTLAVHGALRADQYQTAHGDPAFMWAEPTPRTTLSMPLTPTHAYTPGFVGVGAAAPSVSVPLAVKNNYAGPTYINAYAPDDAPVRDDEAAGVQLLGGTRGWRTRLTPDGDFEVSAVPNVSGARPYPPPGVIFQDVSSNAFTVPEAASFYGTGSYGAIATDGSDGRASAPFVHDGGTSPLVLPVGGSLTLALPSSVYVTSVELGAPDAAVGGVTTLARIDGSANGVTWEPLGLLSNVSGAATVAAALQSPSASPAAYVRFTPLSTFVPGISASIATLGYRGYEGLTSYAAASLVATAATGRRALQSRVTLPTGQYSVVVNSNADWAQAVAPDAALAVAGTAYVHGDLRVRGTVSALGNDITSPSLSSPSVTPPSPGANDLLLQAQYLLLNPTSTGFVGIGYDAPTLATEINNTLPPSLAAKTPLRAVVLDNYSGAPGTTNTAVARLRAPYASRATVLLENASARLGLSVDTNSAGTSIARIEDVSQGINVRPDYAQFWSAAYDRLASFNADAGIAPASQPKGVVTAALRPNGTKYGFVARRDGVVGDSLDTLDGPRIALQTAVGGTQSAAAVLGLEAGDKLTLRIARSTATADALATGGVVDAATPIVTVVKEGRVGINTTSPQFALDVHGGLGSNGAVRLVSSGVSPQPQLRLQCGTVTDGLVDYALWASNSEFRIERSDAVTGVSPVLHMDGYGRLGLRSAPRAPYNVNVDGSLNVGGLWVNGYPVAISPEGFGQPDIDFTLSASNLFLNPKAATGGGIVVNGFTPTGNLLHIFSGTDANLATLDSGFTSNLVYLRAQAPSGTKYNLFRLGVVNGGGADGSALAVHYKANAGTALRLRSSDNTGYVRAVAWTPAPDGDVRPGELDQTLGGNLALEGSAPAVTFGAVGGTGTVLLKRVAADTLALNASAAGGRFGVHTLEPQAALHLRSISSTDTTLRVDNGSAAPFTAQLTSTLASGATCNLYVDRLGRVGVGKEPAVELDVVGSISASLDVNVARNLFVAGVQHTGSDARLKERVVAIDGALDKLCALTGCTYFHKGLQAPQTGLIAQDVQRVLPEAVETDPRTGLLSLAYGNMLGLVVEAIKELRAEVQALKEQK